jgi:hypothetical protein
MRWRSLEVGPIAAPCRRWPEIAQTAALAFPEKWNAAAPNVFEREYNVRYVPVGPDETLFCGFPDGYMMTVACYLPVRRIRAALDFDAQTAASREFAVGTHSSAALAWSAVNYIEGRNPNISLGSVPLTVKAIAASGMSVTGMPTRETAADGSQAATVRGFHYYLLVGCVWRDLEATLTQLRDSGFVGPACGHDWPEEPPFAPEYGAMILRAGMEMRRIDIAFMDPGRTRRIVHQDIAPADFLAQLARARNVRRDAALRQIEAVEAFSSDLQVRLRDGIEKAANRNT